jgi:hypothetical protein
MGESMTCLDKVYTLESYQGVERVDIGDLRLVSRQIFKREKINLALIGPLKEENKKIYSKLGID